MIRKWIRLSDINPFSGMHFKADNEHGFDVKEKEDGQSLEDHVRGIKYIEGVIAGGRKTTPILIEKVIDGQYRLLDGFKRYMAFQSLKKPIIECFVATPEEVSQKRKYKYMGLTMEATLGGQSYFHTRIPLIEGKDTVAEPGLEDIDTLYHGEHIRLEYCECFHVHWGHHGKYRLKLGYGDFMALADAFEEVKL